ncbi:MAG: glycosyltransferase family 2 protein, partial [Candidatus Omnitrophica bacterium]|nr:glycosyltransferase family 2 protein [Candidatus Omnitrophota bacterium]
MSNNFIDVSIVSPVFNEEEVIRDFYNKVSEVLDAAKVNYEIVFVDDGSRDRSFELLKAIHNAAPQRITVVKFARNFGHQIAITAGIRKAKGKSVVVMDCDLQDPPEVILGFIEKWNEGHDVVYGVRTQRKG